MKKYLEKNPEIMDQMKRLTAVKQKIEKRLKDENKELMNKILVIGGSKGIGNAIIKSLVDENSILNISRTAPLLFHDNLTHYTCDILTDDLPEAEDIDTLIYCPGSINLKPISRLKLDDFRNDFRN